MSVLLVFFNITLHHYVVSSTDSDDDDDLPLSPHPKQKRSGGGGILGRSYAGGTEKRGNRNMHMPCFWSFARGERGWYRGFAACIHSRDIERAGRGSQKCAGARKSDPI